jgi:hypothetical protein
MPPRAASTPAASTEALLLRLASTRPASVEELDAGLLLELQKRVRSDERELRAAVSAVKMLLRSESSEKRLAGLAVASFLFRRSKLTRSLLCNWLPELVAATCGGGDAAIPPPALSAERLRLAAHRVLRSWHAVWGKQYAQLGVALQRLALLPSLGVRSDADEAAAAAARARTVLLQRRRAGQAGLEADFSRARTVLTQADECVAALAARGEAAVPQEEEQWVDAEAPSALELLLRLPPAPPADVVSRDALRAVLHDLLRMQQNVERWLVMLRQTDAGGPALAEGTSLRAALDVAAERCSAMAGEGLTTSPMLAPPAESRPPPQAAASFSSRPQQPPKRLRLEASLARLRNTRGGTPRL